MRLTTNLYLIPIQMTYSILLKFAALGPQNATECFEIAQSFKNSSCSQNSWYGKHTCTWEADSSCKEEISIFKLYTLFLDYKFIFNSNTKDVFNSVKMSCLWAAKCNQVFCNWSVHKVFFLLL